MFQHRGEIKWGEGKPTLWTSFNCCYFLCKTMKKKQPGLRRCGTSMQRNTTQLQKECNNAICSNRDGPRDYHIKWSKAERERRIPYGITFLWNLKYNTNELNCETESDSETRLVVAKVRGKGEGMDWEIGISRCKLLYTDWINNTDLLYSTGNYIHYLVLSHNGKKKCTCMYNNHSAIQQKLRQHYKSTTHK